MTISHSERFQFKTFRTVENIYDLSQLTEVRVVLVLQQIWYKNALDLFKEKEPQPTVAVITL